MKICSKDLLPARFGRDLVEGEILYVRNYEDIEREYEESDRNIRCGWSRDCRHICGRSVVVDRNLIRNIEDRDSAITSFDRVNVSLDMLETAEAHQEYLNRLEYIKGLRESIDSKLPTIIKKDETIIQEMIKKVDFNRFMNLLSIMGDIRNGDKFFVTKDQAQAFLRRWAEAKYDFYLLFGKQLTISDTVEYKIDYSEFEIMVYELCEKYPEHALTLVSFSSDEWMENVFYIGNHRRFSAALPQLSKDKMKLTKFISQLVKNNQLDIDISKIYQVSSIKGKVVASIDPYDYLTMSINQHDWNSCHNITDGCYATGAASYLCDKTTVIGYRSNDKTYNYRFREKFKFSGNSKSWRQCVYIDTVTASSIFGRQYPNQFEGMSDALRKLVTSQIDAYANDQTPWEESDNGVENRVFDVSNLHYNDVKHGYKYTVATKTSVPEVKSIMEWHMGSEHTCIRCGSKLKSNNYHLVCSSCS